MDNVAVKVDHVSKVFKLPHEKQSSLKSSLINFRKRGYELQRALDNVSFEVKRGEFFGIIGRNGSGKSTLLKLLAGIYAPTKGEIKINGSLTPFIELGVGFNPELTGRENIFLNGALLGFGRKQMQAMYKDIVDFAELEKFMDQKLKNYSSGMQVRLAFSIAIRAQNDILLLDEVLAVGDAAFQRKCLDYFDHLKSEKKTVVFVSHSMDQVLRFCDRALLMDGGQVQYIGSTDEAVSKHLLNSAKLTESAKEKKSSSSFEFISVKMDKTPEKYKSSENIGFTIKYRLKKSILYDIGIRILKSGIPLYDSNTQEMDLPTNAGSHELFWEAPAASLINGVHVINVAAFTRPEFKLMAYKNDAASFFVENDDKQSGGLMDLKSKWRPRK